MRRLQSGSDLNRNLQGFTEGHPVAVEALAQRYTVDKFGDQEMRLILRAEFKDGQNVRMIERGSGKRLTLKTKQAIRVRSEPLRQDFQRHPSPQTPIFGQQH